MQPRRVVCRQLAAVDMSRSIVVTPPDPYPFSNPLLLSLSTLSLPPLDFHLASSQSHSFSICQHDDILLFAQCLVASLLGADVGVPGNLLPTLPLPASPRFYGGLSPLSYFPFHLQHPALYLPPTLLLF